MTKYSEHSRNFVKSWKSPLYKQGMENGTNNISWPNPFKLLTLVYINASQTRKIGIKTSQGHSTKSATRYKSKLK